LLLSFAFSKEAALANRKKKREHRVFVAHEMAERERYKWHRPCGSDY
jgi:hypothetical protein